MAGQLLIGVRLMRSGGAVVNCSYCIELRLNESRARVVRVSQIDFILMLGLSAAVVVPVRKVISQDHLRPLQALGALW